jgi:ribonuclease III family protein
VAVSFLEFHTLQRGIVWGVKPLLDLNGIEALEPGMLSRLSPLALAYLGDGVYELWVRRSLLLPPKRPDDYHRQVVNHVRAERQAIYLESLVPQLDEMELDIVRRGRNAAPKTKRVNPAIYQKATGFESLIGYLYLKDPERLSALLRQLDLHQPIESVVRIKEPTGVVSGNE